MSRLPVPGGDLGAWGTILNDFLGVGHAANGDLQAKNGTLLFGAAGDAMLTRQAAKSLFTDGDLHAEGFVQAGHLRTLGNYAFVAAANVDAGLRLMILNDGKITWGDGTGYTGDTNLYRSAPNTLATDDGLEVGGALSVTASITSNGDIGARWGVANRVLVGDYGGYPGIVFASDTSLYRPVAGQIKTDGALFVGGILYTQGGATLDWGSAGAKLAFGSAQDTNLYRSAADTLKTDDLFVPAGGISLLAGANIALATATGTKLGTSATQLLGFWNANPRARPTGWGAPTGTATRTTFATGSVTLPLLAERVKALIDDLTSIGLIGA